jgi:hypothetical protein
MLFSVETIMDGAAIPIKKRRFRSFSLLSQIALRNPPITENTTTPIILTTAVKRLGKASRGGADTQKAPNPNVYGLKPPAKPIQNFFQAVHSAGGAALFFGFDGSDDVSDGVSIVTVLPQLSTHGAQKA